MNPVVDLWNPGMTMEECQTAILFRALWHYNGHIDTVLRDLKVTKYWLEQEINRQPKLARWRKDPVVDSST